MSKNTRNSVDKSSSAVKTMVPGADGQLVETSEPVGAKTTKARGKRGKRELSLDDPYNRQIINEVAVKNPKREGSAAHKRFALYKSGMTVFDFLTAGGTRGDINWDVDHEHIKLEPGKAVPVKAE